MADCIIKTDKFEVVDSKTATEENIVLREGKSYNFADKDLTVRYRLADYYNSARVVFLFNNKVIRTVFTPQWTSIAEILNHFNSLSEKELHNIYLEKVEFEALEKKNELVIQVEKESIKLEQLKKENNSLSKENADLEAKIVFNQQVLNKIDELSKLLHINQTQPS